MIHVDIAKDIEDQLRALSAESGRSLEDHVREALEAYVADLPDPNLIAERRAEVAQGLTLSMAEMKARLGLDG